MPITQKKYLKQLKRERRRWKKRYIRKLAAKRARGFRVFCGMTALAVFLYLAAVGYFSRTVFDVKEEYNGVFLKEEIGDEPPERRELYRIRLKLKTGELIFYREQVGDLDY